jgi:hypothetical protein
MAKEVWQCPFHPSQDFLGSSVLNQLQRHQRPPQGDFHGQSSPRSAILSSSPELAMFSVREDVCLKHELCWPAKPLLIASGLSALRRLFWEGLGEYLVTEHG